MPAQKFQSDVEKRARNLDSKYPGSTFIQRLKSYGKDSEYLVLAVGPFANLSAFFWFYETSSVVYVRSRRSTGIANSPNHAFAINRHILITRFLVIWLLWRGLV